PAYLGAEPVILFRIPGREAVAGNKARGIGMRKVHGGAGSADGGKLEYGRLLAVGDHEYLARQEVVRVRGDEFCRAVERRHQRPGDTGYSANDQHVASRIDTAVQCVRQPRRPCARIARRRGIGTGGYESRVIAGAVRFITLDAVFDVVPEVVGNVEVVMDCYIRKATTVAGHPRVVGNVVQ